MDIDGNEKVHWNEFLSAVISATIFNKEENLKEIYYFFDREKKGYFDGEDFKKGIADPFLTMAYTNFDDVITQAFHGKDKITFEDFKLFMLSADGAYD